MEEVFERLFARRRFGMKPGLALTRALLERFGNPQCELGVVHVAGTNGKGALCAMLAAVLQKAGYPTGCYTSPHLLQFNERFVLNGRQVPDKDLIRAAREVEAVADELVADGYPPATFFECATVIAFTLFREAGIRLVVLETGMGGRLDATNVITPLVAAITRIGVDHADWLGESLEEIAGEKGGIIKAGRPVVLGAMPEKASERLGAMAAQRGATCLAADQLVLVERLSGDLSGQKMRISSGSRDLGVLDIPLAGVYQSENAATCVAVCDVLNDLVGIPVSDAALRAGLESAVWPGRFQLVREAPPVIVDGAHNPSAAEALAATLKLLARGRPVTAVMGMCSDKDVRGCLRALSPVLSHIRAVPVATPRTMPVDQILASAASAGIPAEKGESLEAVLPEAESWAGSSDGLVLVCGSLFLAGQALDYYKVLGPAENRLDPNEMHSPAAEADEKKGCRRQT